MSSRQFLSALAAAAAVRKASAAMGPAFSTGPVADDSFIRESWATLVLPSTPSDNKGVLSLWVGMGTSNGDLVQSIADNWESDNWSVYAYTLMSTGGSSHCPESPMLVCWLQSETSADNSFLPANSQMPVQDDGSTAEADTHVTFHCEQIPQFTTQSPSPHEKADKSHRRVR